MNCRLLLSSLLLMSSFFLESSMKFLNEYNQEVGPDYRGSMKSIHRISMPSFEIKYKASYLLWKELNNKHMLSEEDQSYIRFDEKYQNMNITTSADFIKMQQQRLQQTAANREQNNQAAAVQQPIQAPVVQVAPVVNQANSNCSWCPRLFPRRPQVHPEQANH
ncbi:MAG: hypothetical protein ACXWL2_02475 [Candidatus Chromulinivorax sp.]